MAKELHGAAAITHGIKEYGNGKSMKAGLERLEKESRQIGQREGFQKGIKFAFENMSPLQSLFGRRFK